MTRYSPESEDDDEEEDFSGEPEYSPESGDEGTFKCPNCSAEIYGGASRCPKCGDYVTPGARSTAASLPRWMWAAALLVILALIAGAIRSFR